MGTHRAIWVALLAGSSLLVGCGDDATSILSFAVPTEVAVDPADFLGDTSCSANAGAMRSYVMTLSAFEVETEDQTATDTAPFLIGSTQPAACSLIAGFRDVIVIGQRHIAEVDGYDFPATLLEPFGATSSGSRQMRHVETGELVSPRWTTRCGAGSNEGATAVATRRVFVRPCEELIDSAPTPTQLLITAEHVLGENACDVAPSFTLMPDAAGLAPAVDVACDADAVAYDVDPGTSHELYATTMIGDVPHGSICSATAVLGVSVAVRCNPLSSSGSATISLSDLRTTDDEPVCPTGAFFDVVAGETVLNTVPLPCSSATQVGPLSAGLSLLEVVVSSSTGEALGRGSCAAEIAPGRTATALCLANQ